MKDNSYSKKLANVKQIFISKFKQCSENQERLPFLFRTNPNIYSAEPQIPEIFLKTINKFDKNTCFSISTSKLGTILEPNILEEGSFEAKQEDCKANTIKSLSVNKVDVDDLFSSKRPSKKEKKAITINVFGDDFESNNQQARNSNPKPSNEGTATTITEQQTRQPSPPKNTGPESPQFETGNNNPLSGNGKNKFNSLVDSKTLETLPGAKIFNEDNLVKKYFLVLKNEYNYGPYNTTELFLFLSHLQKKPNDDKFDFLIVDAMTDVFYNPPDLLEQLKDKLNSAEKKFVIEQEIARATLTTNTNSASKPIYVNVNPNAGKTEPRVLEPREEVKGLNSKYDKVKYNPSKVYERKLKQPNSIVPKYDIPYFHKKFQGAEYLPLNIFSKDPNIKKAFKSIHQQQNPKFTNPNYQPSNRYRAASPKIGGNPNDFLTIATPTSVNNFQHGRFGQTPKSPMFFNDVTPKSVIHFNFNQNTPKNFLNSPSNKYDYLNCFGVSPKSGTTPTYSKIKKTDLHTIAKFQNLATVEEKQVTNITDSIFD